VPQCPVCGGIFLTVCLSGDSQKQAIVLE